VIEQTVIGYKFVTSDLKSKNGDATWVVGEWKNCEGALKLCENGFHASEEPLDSLNYVYGDRWFAVEARDEFKRGDDKFVAREMRLLRELPVKQILVAFAVACAKRCYKNWRATYPKGKRVWNAIKAAEKWLKDPTEANRKACESAGSAARSAESAAWSAGSAARSAESAARSAESAARSAGSAARSAGSAARSAESAARSAESAARSAERKWQSRTLNRLIRENLEAP
jgi:hypothetical protein